MIALGIILAISAESLWQERADRREEVQHLNALRNDFEQSLELLDAAEQQQNTQVQYLQFLLQGKAETSESSEVREWLRAGLYTIGTFEPQLSALQDLESSGKTQLIQDAALRRALAGLQQKVDELEVIQSDLSISQQELIDPYLISHLYLASILDIGELSVAGNNGPLEFDRSILGTVDFRNRIAFKLSLRRGVLEEEGELRAQFHLLLDLIRKKLESG